MSGKAYTKLIGFVGLLVAVCVMLPGIIAPSTGVGTTVDPGKTGNMVIVYGVVAMLSVLLLIGYTWLAKQRDSRFVLLFTCVATTNCGYFWLSCSRSLTGAMMANRLSYLGAAFAVLVMMFIVMDACRVERKKWVNATGKVSDERYATMALSYEEEQQELKEALPEMQRYLETETDKTESLQKFIDKVKRITQIKELTPELVHEFIDKIVVYAPRYLDGKRVQIMDIYYNGVGILRELTPEEMEEAFQKHIAERKEKTA